ncbi:hypothetical protein SAMN05660297_00192 [Natronincola peptidivorans]|uniref:Flagellar motility protein MotE, a chaperone for MotC folding n=1 Tax=Natronincola peptidivorans TaxID=426128 RepID=A0A1H9YEM3_9FIRM|nr:hypothetical protein [Natronincola peptidivorans]SES67425.1 hypothetical protein SAMN05660297_00192 [Natronincola peptidivorans]
MTTNLRENDNKGLLKGIIIVIIAFLFIPIMTMLIMYFSNEDFRHSTNNVLSILPGNLGGYFQGQPTKTEIESLKLQIAKYYITFEEDRLVDKLLIIKGEDSNLYDDLIILLSRENPMKMRNVNEKLRSATMQSNSMQRILEEIDEDKITRIDELNQYFLSLKMPQSISEIQRTYRNGELKSEELPVLFEKLPIDISAQYLLYLDPEITEQIMFNLRQTIKKEIEKKMEEIQSRQDEMMRLASIYEKKSLEEQIEDLGNIDRFRQQDLAIIYKNMSIKSGGRILASVEDNDFIAELYENINALELLHGKEAKLAVDLSEAVQIYKNYETKVKELVDVYERMSLQELTNVIQQMIRNNNVYQQYTIRDEEIVFTEERLVIDVLNRLRPAKVAALLEQLNTQSSVNLSQKFVID